MRTKPSNDQQRIGALFGFGRRVSNSERGKLVASCLYVRGLRSWTKPGSYAWFRLNDDLHRAQLALRKARGEA